MDDWNMTRAEGCEKIYATSVCHHADIRLSGGQRFPSRSNCRLLLFAKTVVGRFDFVQVMVLMGVSWHLRTWGVVALVMS